LFSAVSKKLLDSIIIKAFQTNPMLYEPPVKRDYQPTPMIDATD